MILQHVEIKGFRGIAQLSLPLEQGNVLIGENAWGKSSLLDALTLLFSPQQTLYAFSPHDFHGSREQETAAPRTLSLTFTFSESEENERRSARLRPFRHVWQQSQKDALHHIMLRIEATLKEGEVTTRREFTCGEGKTLPPGESDALMLTLIRMQPVLRLRDARFTRRLRYAVSPETPGTTLIPLVNQIDNLAREMIDRPQMLTDDEIRQGLLTIQQLLEHYFSVQPAEGERQARSPHDNRQDKRGWRALDNLNHLVAKADSRNRQLILLRMFALLLRAKGAQNLDPLARPILLIEDPETRLHPIMLAVAWGLLSVLPLQKITTTNSGDLLSQVPVEEVCRLVRHEEQLRAWRLGAAKMNPLEQRRIAFHIRFNRPSSLFARCWLLVEGETEVWIMNQLAQQCGFHFASEGIKVIEYAQSGLRPLLNFAQRMGIEWHVLTDGDDAGKKYAATTRSHIHAHGLDEGEYLTPLPARDMEHFLYKAGFASLYHRVARLPENVPMSTRRIISKAIQRASKPELAIAVATDAAARGPEAVPPLLYTVFATVQWLARNKAA